MGRARYIQYCSRVRKCTHDYSSRNLILTIPRLLGSCHPRWSQTCGSRLQRWWCWRLQDVCHIPVPPPQTPHPTTESTEQVTSKCGMFLYHFSTLSAKCREYIDLHLLPHTKRNFEFNQLSSLSNSKGTLLLVKGHHRYIRMLTVYIFLSAHPTTKRLVLSSSGLNLTQYGVLLLVNLDIHLPNIKTEEGEDLAKVCPHWHQLPSSSNNLIKKFSK